MINILHLIVISPAARAMSHKIAVASITLLFIAWQSVNASAEPSAGELFKQVEDRFSSISTLSYTVKRVSVSRKQNSEDRWQFRLKKPGRVRIDYQVPHERLIIMDSETIWEYIPSLKKAAKTELASMSREKQEEAVSQVMARVSVDGLRMGRYVEMEKKASRVKTVTWSGSEVYQVDGADPKYVVYIDKARSTLLRMEIYDPKGDLVIKTESSRFIEATQGFWLPREIRATYNTPSGFVQSTVTLQDIRVNDMVDDALFRFAVPKGIEVILH